MPAKLEKTRYPGVFRRGERYVYFYRDPQRRQRMVSGFRTAAQARDQKRRRDNEIHDGQYFAASDTPAADYLEEWVDTYTGRGRRGFRDSTRADYQEAIRLYLAPWLRERNLALGQVTPRDVNALVAWLCAQQNGRKTDQLSDSRVRNVLSPLRSALATAVEDGLIRHNPAVNIRLPNREHENDDVDDDVKAMSRRELAAWLDKSPDGWRLAFDLLAATGLRWGEFAALQCKHLQLAGGQPGLKVRRRLYRGSFAQPKSRYGRRDLPLDPQLAARLREHMVKTGRRGDDLVWQTRAGTPLDHSNFVRDVMGPTRRRTGLDWVGLHTFRHTCATLLFAGGRNAVQVQRWLGHHSPAFTLATYVHLLDEDLGQPVDLQAELARARRLEAVR